MTDEIKLPETGFLRVNQIVGDPKNNVPPLIPVGRSTWWSWCASGRAPAPIKLGPRTTVWRVEDIRAFIDLSVERLLNQRRYGTDAAGTAGGGRAAGRARLLERATGYLPHVRQHSQDMVEEMEGIAEGAGVTLEEVLFLQVRTHLMKPPEGGCTAFALEPGASGTGGALIGQNWDWDPNLEDV